jgi:isoleucyl-tRNA synthetase
MVLEDVRTWANYSAGPQFEGKDIFKDGNRLVIEELQNRNVLLKKEDYTHRYPYDWRTKKPVIWRATKQWFTDLTHIKDTAIEEVNNVQLVPPSGMTLKTCFNLLEIFLDCVTCHSKQAIRTAYGYRFAPKL